MGFWRWLLKILSEPPPERTRKGKSRDRYVPGGMDRFFPGSMRHPTRQFRRSFGDHYGDEEEEN